MLLPSILRILDQCQIQSKTVKSAESGFQAEMTAAAEGISGLEKTESTIGNADDLVRPVNLEPSVPEKPLSEQSLGELLRILTKFEKSNQKRVVDFFE